MGYTKEEILEIIEEEDVEFIRLQFTDMFGVMKNVAITVSQLEKALNNQCKFDGSLIEGFARVEESDMYLYPDLDSFTIFPWRPQRGKVARFICDVRRIDGTPFAGDPRYVLKKAIQDAKDMGFDAIAEPECEFFLFESDDEGNPTNITHEKAGYFDVGPADTGENARRDIVLNLEEMGFEVIQSYHEIAPGQHAIVFAGDNALKTADNIVTFRFAVKSIAKRHGLHATFMPKPNYGVNGSGMHMHIELRKDGKNVFADANDENGISKIAYQFMAGIIKHIKGTVAITNPLVNSYKRLVPGYDAPIYIAWSKKNKSSLMCISDVKGDKTRVEIRCPDSAANPYLTLATYIEAGLDGIRNNLELEPQVEDNIFKMDKEEIRERGIEVIPDNLYDAITELKKDEYIKNVLGEHIYKNYTKTKVKEWQHYRTQVTKWEIDQYLGKF